MYLISIYTVLLGFLTLKMILSFYVPVRVVITMKPPISALQETYYYAPATLITCMAGLSCVRSNLKRERKQNVDTK